MNDRRGLVCFDWDGTLVNSHAKIATCAQRAFEHLGRHIPIEEIEPLIGQSESFITQQLFRDAPEEASIFWHDFRTQYQQGSPTALIPFAREILTQLYPDFVIAIVTNKGKTFLEKEIEFNKINQLIDYTYTADLWCAKPDPQMILAAMEESQHPADRTLMIGDSEADQRAAEAAGITFIPLHAPWHPDGITLTELTARIRESI